MKRPSMSVEALLCRVVLTIVCVVGSLMAIQYNRSAFRHTLTRGGTRQKVVATRPSNTTTAKTALSLRRNASIKEGCLS